MKIDKTTIYIVLLFISIILTGEVTLSQSKYNTFTSQTYNFMQNETECTLFILDYSQSMKEYIGNTTKNSILKSSMNKILTNINPNYKTGVRIYGHKKGVFLYQACKASELTVPISKNNCNSIINTLNNIKPAGMTPITYSLKQAVLNDFHDCKGDKHIILITDGGENCDESPCDYILSLIKERNDIIIDVIALDITNKEDISQLECVALATNGKIYTVNNLTELTKGITNAIHHNTNVSGKIIPK